MCDESTDQGYKDVSGFAICIVNNIHLFCETKIICNRSNRHCQEHTLPTRQAAHATLVPLSMSSTNSIDPPLLILFGVTTGLVSHFNKEQRERRESGSNNLRRTDTLRQFGTATLLHCYTATYTATLLHCSYGHSFKLTLGGGFAAKVVEYLYFHVALGVWDNN